MQHVKHNSKYKDQKSQSTITWCASKNRKAKSSETPNLVWFMYLSFNLGSPDSERMQDDPRPATTSFIKISFRNLSVLHFRSACLSFSSVLIFRAPTWESAPPERVEKCRPPTVLKCRTPSRGLKQSQAFPGRNYFITMHHQAGVNFENFTEVKFRDILLSGTGHQDRRLNRESPGQTGTYGESNLNQNLNLNLTSGSFVKDHLLFLLFTKSAAPGHCPPPPPPLSGTCSCTKYHLYFQFWAVLSSMICFNA